MSACVVVRACGEIKNAKIRSTHARWLDGFLETINKNEVLLKNIAKNLISVRWCTKRRIGLVCRKKHLVVFQRRVGLKTFLAWIRFRAWTISLHVSLMTNLTRCWNEGNNHQPVKNVNMNVIKGKTVFWRKKVLFWKTIVFWGENHLFGQK